MSYTIKSIANLYDKIEILQEYINEAVTTFKYDKEVKVVGRLWSSAELDQDAETGAEFHNSSITFGLTIVCGNSSRNFTGQITEMKLIISAIYYFVDVWKPKEEAFLSALHNYYS